MRTSRKSLWEVFSTVWAVNLGSRWLYGTSTVGAYLSPCGELTAAFYAFSQCHT